MTLAVHWPQKMYKDRDQVDLEKANLLMVDYI